MKVVLMRFLQKNIVLDGFFYLNLRDTIATDGNLGQKGCINFSTEFAQILKPIFSRKNAPPNEIYNSSMIC